MKNGLKSLTILAIILFAGTLMAEQTYAGINKKQHNQQKRIAQGISSGELTGREAVRLKKEQMQIARKERIFKSDGNFTRRERAILNHDLKRASRHIFKEKNDGQSR